MAIVIVIICLNKIRVVEMQFSQTSSYLHTYVRLFPCIEQPLLLVSHTIDYITITCARVTVNDGCLTCVYKSALS